MSPYIIFFTGASGAGKTSLVQALSKELPSQSTICLHFDSMGVPSEEEMIRQYGSGSEWQKAMTYRWVKKLTTDFQDKKLVLFEGQVNLDFITSAFKEANFNRYSIILIHCNVLTRHKRLHHQRNQPELINDQMDNWSKFLKNQAEAQHVPILDTTNMKPQDMVTWVKIFLKKGFSEDQT